MTGDIVMTQWIIYFNPSDYPGKYVARGFDIVRGKTEPRPRAECWIFETLETARLAITTTFPGLVMLARHASDPAPVVEVWL